MDSDAVDEILRKIGRNLLLFQRIEGMLKLLVANSQVRGYAKDIDQVRARRVTGLQKQSMGQLVGQFTDEVLTNVESESDIPVDINEAWVSFTFTLEADSAFYEQKSVDLAAMVSRAQRADTITFCRCGTRARPSERRLSGDISIASGRRSFRPRLPPSRDPRSSRRFQVTG